jgi:peroxin-4
MDPTQKRLLKELRDYQKNPNAQVEDLRPVEDDNLFAWHCYIVGQEGTPYEGTFSCLEV